MSQCAQHPGVAATYQCDGCQRLLCEQCVDESHRLILCRICGERALPLAATQPANTTQLAYKRRHQTAYSMVDAFAYPLRGNSAWLFWVYVALTTLLAVLAWVPGLGLAAGLFSLALLGLLAAMVLRIIFQTSEGNNELPSWPDFDLFALLRDIFKLIAATVVGLAPIFLLLELFGPGFLRFFLGEGGALGWLLFVVGLATGAVLGLVALGSVALYDQVLGAFRIDLHLAAIRVMGTDLIKTVGFVVALTVAVQILKLIVLLGVPLVGGILQAAIGTYGLFTTAHLIGLLYRRHEEEVNAIYLGS